MCTILTKRITIITAVKDTEKIAYFKINLYHFHV